MLSAHLIASYQSSFFLVLVIDSTFFGFNTTRTEAL